MSRLQQDHLVIPQGTTWAVRWPLLDQQGNAVETIGWTVRSQVRRSHLDKEILHEWSTEKGNATVFDSFVELRVDPQESTLWAWGSAKVVYDVEVTLPTGEVLRLTQGTITISREITK